MSATIAKSSMPTTASKKRCVVSPTSTAISTAAVRNDVCKRATAYAHNSCTCKFNTDRIYPIFIFENALLLPHVPLSVNRDLPVSSRLPLPHLFIRRRFRRAEDLPQAFENPRSSYGTVD